MGNFLTTDLSRIPEGYKVWHLLLAVLVIYYIPSALKFPVWLWRTILNRQMARRMREERDSYHVDFSKIPYSSDKLDKEKFASQLLYMSVKDLRQGLFNGDFTSVDLVVFYGARCQKVGREMNYSCEELFDSALKKAKECD